MDIDTDSDSETNVIGAAADIAALMTETATGSDRIDEQTETW